jgi:hypothetical protein
MNTITLGMGAVAARYYGSNGPEEDVVLSLTATRRCRPLRLLCTSESSNFEMGQLLGVSVAGAPEVVLGKGIAFNLVQQQGGWAFPDSPATWMEAGGFARSPWLEIGETVTVRVRNLDLGSAHMLSAALVVELP